MLNQKKEKLDFENEKLTPKEIRSVKSFEKLGDEEVIELSDFFYQISELLYKCTFEKN